MTYERAESPSTLNIGWIILIAATYTLVMQGGRLVMATLVDMEPKMPCPECWTSGIVITWNEDKTIPTGIGPCSNCKGVGFVS